MSWNFVFNILTIIKFYTCNVYNIFFPDSQKKSKSFNADEEDEFSDCSEVSNILKINKKFS